jgi:hypothetical protein
MANVIKLRKGLNINLKGKAARQKFSSGKCAQYALVPDDFVGMTPKVVVREGDKVKAGDLLADLRYSFPEWQVRGVECYPTYDVGSRIARNQRLSVHWVRHCMGLRRSYKPENNFTTTIVIRFIFQSYRNCCFSVTVINHLTSVRKYDILFLLGL